jgi:hypothetical protein
MVIFHSERTACIILIIDSCPLGADPLTKQVNQPDEMKRNEEEMCVFVNQFRFSSIFTS